MNVHESQISVMGRSIGTGVAINLCTKRKPGALYLITPFTKISDIAKSFVGRFSWLIKDSFNLIHKAPLIGCPTLVMHGIFDELIPYELAEELAQKIPNCELYISNKMEHNKISIPELKQCIVNFMFKNKL